MAVLWNAHRFSGGLLALDTTNTVVLRGVAGMTFDRFDDTREIARFADHASRFRAEELGGRSVEANDPHAVRAIVLEMREATDALFRDQVVSGTAGGAATARFLRACADGVANGGEPIGDPERPFGRPDTPLALEAAVAVSALSLLQPAISRRIRICANCNWLFVDRSRNSSRMWCDMKVCGNRQKAKRHYNRHRRSSGGYSHA